MVQYPSNQTVVPHGTRLPLGFQPSGRSFGGQGGGSLMQTLLKMWAGGKMGASGAQTSALAQGAGPVTADTANTMAQMPSASYASMLSQTPFQDKMDATQRTMPNFARNPYYQTGFTGRGLY